MSVLLRLHEVVVRRQQREILHGISLAFEPGTVTALVGPNGAGKSTLLAVAAGDLRAVVGEVSNGEHNLESLGKAGAKRWLGVRPTVRGVAMNPVDHPHGGGEGRSSGGRHPCTPWGVPTKGYKTRKNKRTTAMIVRRRKQR